MDVVSTKIPPALRRAVEAEAARYGMTVSEYLRFQLRRLTDMEPEGLDELGDEDRQETVAAA